MLPLRKKLVLVAVCSMTVFMMICAIIRIGVGIKEKLTDLSWFLLWNSVEMTLGTFSTFFFLLQRNMAMFQRPNSCGCLPTTPLPCMTRSLSTYVYGIHTNSSRLNVQLN